MKIICDCGNEAEFVVLKEDKFGQGRNDGNTRFELDNKEIRIYGGDYDAVIRSDKCGKFVKFYT